MPRLKWTPEALADVARLHAFLAHKSEDAARRAVAAIREGIATLERHPQPGRPMAEMEPEFREWLIEFGAGGYVALYRFDGSEVVMLAVRHVREAGHQALRNHRGINIVDTSRGPCQRIDIG